MKSAFLALLLVAPICAQPPASPVQAIPGGPIVGAPGAAHAAPAPDEMKSDTVVFEANGKKYTKAEVDKLMALLPPQYQAQARVQPQMLSTILIFQKLAEDAVKDELDKRSPYQEQIEFNRTQILAQAEVTIKGNSYIVADDEQKKYYSEHPEKYQEAKVSVIYVAFNPAPGKTAAEGKALPSEADAKAKIEDLRKQIAGGADFGKLARENSDEKASAAKDGDFGVIKHNSAYPEPVKAAVFALKPGELSQPIRLPNGFYLIRLEQMISPPFDEISTQLLQDMKQERFQDWMKSLQSQYTIKVVDPAYFAPKPPPAQLQQVR
ncbi:MAG TPA: peptidylprolyl isomerase [Bryobacteraceae bacterium]|nr:peptidylprolyl isomerase [Bryobacteraceae bacterium]